MSTSENNTPAPTEEVKNEEPMETKEDDASAVHKEEDDIDKGAGGDHKEEDEKDGEKEEEESKDESSKKASPKKKKEVVVEEEEEEEEEEPKLGLLERPVVIETGRKREKKKVERLDVSSASTPKDKKLEIPEGKGTKLGEIPRVELQINKTSSDDLKPLHRILFNRPGSAVEVKRNMRKFCGFVFEKGTAEYEKKLQYLNKFTMAMLKMVCEVLDLERSGHKETVVSRVMEFLLDPHSSGKALPKAKRKRPTGGEKGQKQKKKPKEDKDEKKGKKAKSKEQVDSESESEEEEEEEEESESGEESKSEAEEQPKKKRAKIEAPKKPAKKDSKKSEKKSTPPKKSKAVSESSDDDDASSDDEPLVTKKKPPTDDELKEVIKKILDGANLEEVTMKTVCKQVYSKFPEFDLIHRKDFIKSTVKQIIR